MEDPRPQQRLRSFTHQRRAGAQCPSVVLRSGSGRLLRFQILGFLVCCRFGFRLTDMALLRCGLVAALAVSDRPHYRCSKTARRDLKMALCRRQIDTRSLHLMKHCFLFFLVPFFFFLFG